MTALSAARARDLERFTVGLGLPAAWERLRNAAEESVEFTSADAPAAPETGASRLGGLPDLPAGQTWPAGMSHLLQLRLADLASLTETPLLPAAGWLHLFIGAEPETGPLPCQILFTPATSAVEPVAAPAGFLSVDDDAWDGYEPTVVYRPRQLRFHPTVSLPAVGSPAYEAIWTGGEPTPTEFEGYCRLLDILAIERAARSLGRNRICGHPLTDAEETAGPAEEWQLLFDLDSDFELGICFGNAGRLRIWIPREDLAAARFERIVAHLD